MSGELRVLAIQSHVVHGYVGNRAATFPLQLLGLEVDCVNSVQLCNHTGYPQGVRGQVLQASQLRELVQGLEENGLLPTYTHIITGYIGDKGFLQEVAALVRKLKAGNPALVYVCDPVMGDTGPGMYVPKELLPVYQEEILPLADVCLPNQFEAELLTGTKVTTEGEARAVMQSLHGRGVATVILSSTELGKEGSSLVALASRRGSPSLVRLNIPKLAASFVGTGDLFTALSTAWLSRTEGDLKLSLERTVNSMQAVLKRTLNFANLKAKELGLERPSPALMELRLIQSREDILNPSTAISAQTVGE